MLLFATALWPLFQIGRACLGERGAYWTLVFFLAQPLIIVISGRAGTDGLCLALSIWFFYLADRLIQKGEMRWWLPTAVVASLAAVSKVPFFMAMGLAVGLVLLLDRERARSARLWLLLMSIGIVSALAFFAWTHYTNWLAAQAEFPYVELRVEKSGALRSFFFGDLHYRLNPYNWGKGGWRVLNSTLGSLGLIVLPVAGLYSKGSRVAKALLAGAFLTTLVFTQLVLVHSHYFLMVCPGVALLCAAGVKELEHLAPPAAIESYFYTPCIALALALGSVQGLIGSKIALNYDRYPAEICAIIRQHTKPDEKIIIFGGGWGGRELFSSGRKGLSVQTSEALAQMACGKALRSLQELGFNRLVLLSESPLLAALQESNPGSAYKRAHYPSSICPAVDS
ncbi:MAG: glycosyltransferase family 39 protein, partial [Limisphaerales bacterium]